MKIGITIKLDKGKSFQSNGMLQNLYFLAKAFNEVDEFECYFLYSSDFEPDLILEKNRCISISEYIVNPLFEFDIIILGGFSSKVFSNTIFANTKIIAFHCGATMEDDIFKCLDQSKSSAKTGQSLAINVDEIWTLPHHSKNLAYLSTLYDNKNAKVVPYVWDSSFIELQLKSNGYKSIHDFRNDLRSKPIDRISIYEPNNTFCKTCLIPLSIAVEHKRHGQQLLKLCRTFCAEQIAKNGHFNDKCRIMGILSHKEYFRFSKRVAFISSLRCYGKNTIVLSHQLNCELNNLYFDCFYLGIPLLHNSTIFSEFGYYYPDSDIATAAKQIDHIVGHHLANFDEYNKVNKKLFEDYNPKNRKNLSVYEEAMRKLSIQ